MIVLGIVSIVVYVWIIVWECKHVDNDENDYPSCQTCLYYTACKREHRPNVNCKRYKKEAKQ